MVSREIIIRAAALYVPMALTGALWWWRRPDRRLATAMLLACAWTAPALFIVHRIAMAAGWWTFGVADFTFAGIPVDLYLGWMLLWGAVPALAFPSLPMGVVALVMAWLDLLIMPLCNPVVRLSGSWWSGEAVAVLAVLLPAQYLARWTAGNRQLFFRAALQVVAFSGLALAVAPAAILQQTGTPWPPLLIHPDWWTSVVVQLLLVPAVVGVSAVQEFAVRGGGTPIPYDAPRRLVSSGPYRYVANPMQLALCLLWLGLAYLLHRWWMVGASVTAFVYSAGLAAWDEDEDLTARFGMAWTEYRRHVGPWWPRWRPFAPASAPDSSARLCVAETCDLCRGVGGWLKRLGLTNLRIVAAETCGPRELWRMTYLPADGGPGEDGVAAFARALEHVNLAWAWAGMLMRLPIVRPALQLLVDASGGYPRNLGRGVSVDREHVG